MSKNLLQEELMFENSFHEKESYSEITYVVARYNKEHDLWHWEYEYVDIETARTKLEYLNSRKHCRYAIFRRVKVETLTILS